MSIYKSKGLEADYVFITGVVDGVLPRKIDGLDAIESQRRLLFVGMTRAQKQLHIISEVEWDGKVIHSHSMDPSQFEFHPKKKIYNGRASPFISEMR